MHLLPKKRAVIVPLAIAALLLLTLVAQASAYTYNLFCINQAASTLPPPGNDAYISQSQLLLTVASVDSDTVSFKISNLGSTNFSVAEIYFYDGSILNPSVYSLNPSAGVSFTAPTAQPPALPSGNDWGLPKGSVIFAADAGADAPVNGINPGESLTIYIDLLANKTFDDVITALNLPTEDDHFPAGSLVIGVHAIAFPDGDSVSLVDVPGGNDIHAPIPPSALLLGSGLLGLIGLRRKSKG